MLKSELVGKIANANPQLYQRDAEYIVDAILNTITMALSRGDRVEVRGFGAFSVKKRRARMGRNPKTNVPVPVHPKYAVVFRAASEMHHRLNGNKMPDATGSEVE